MIIHRTVSGPLMTNAYLVVDGETGRAVIVDAPYESAAALSTIVAREEYRVDRIILTHSHWDHTADAERLRQTFGVPVAVHARDEYRMRDPGAEVIRPPFPLAPMQADEHLAADHVIAVGTRALRVLETPGHTEGSVCLLCADDGLVFTGDTLFAGSVGRTDLPGGSWAALMHSLTTMLMTLPDDTIVYPGHGEGTTIAHEKLLNPFVNGELDG